MKVTNLAVLVLGCGVVYIILDIGQHKLIKLFKLYFDLVFFWKKAR